MRTGPEAHAIQVPRLLLAAAQLSPGWQARAGKGGRGQPRAPPLQFNSRRVQVRGFPTGTRRFKCTACAAGPPRRRPWAAVQPPGGAGGGSQPSTMGHGIYTMPPAQRGHIGRRRSCTGPSPAVAAGELRRRQLFEDLGPRPQVLANLRPRQGMACWCLGSGRRVKPAPPRGGAAARSASPARFQRLFEPRSRPRAHRGRALREPAPLSAPLLAPFPAPRAPWSCGRRALWRRGTSHRPRGRTTWPRGRSAAGTPCGARAVGGGRGSAGRAGRVGSVGPLRAAWFRCAGRRDGRAIGRAESYPARRLQDKAHRQGKHIVAPHAPNSTDMSG